MPCLVADPSRYMHVYMRKFYAGLLRCPSFKGVLIRGNVQYGRGCHMSLKSQRVCTSLG